MLYQTFYVKKMYSIAQAQCSEKKTQNGKMENTKVKNAKNVKM